MPIASVIVPVYDIEQEIHRCIDSILSQTCTDFELILVDDGSPDNCPAICDEYAAKDSRVKVIHKKNGGVSSARNSALDIARGEFIAFCDSDDYWEPHLLETALYAARASNSDLVHYGYREIENGTAVKTKHFQSGIFHFPTDKDRTDYLIQTLLSHRHGWELWDRLFRRDIIEKHHIRCCTTSNNFGEDLNFVCKYILHCQRLCCIEDILYNYCVRSGSIMQSSLHLVRLNDMNEVAYDVWQEYCRIIAHPQELGKFPILHIMFLNDQIIRLGNRGLYAQLPKELQKLKHYKWLQQNIGTLFRCHHALTEYFGPHLARRTLLFATYLLHGNWKLYCFISAAYYKWYNKTSR